MKNTQKESKRWYEGAESNDPGYLHPLAVERYIQDISEEVLHAVPISTTGTRLYGPREDTDKNYSLYELFTGEIAMGIICLGQKHWLESEAYHGALVQCVQNAIVNDNEEHPVSKIIDTTEGSKHRYISPTSFDIKHVALNVEGLVPCHRLIHGKPYRDPYHEGKGKEFDRSKTRY